MSRRCSDMRGSASRRGRDGIRGLLFIGDVKGPTRPEADGPVRLPTDLEATGGLGASCRICGSTGLGLDPPDSPRIGLDPPDSPRRRGCADDPGRGPCGARVASTTSPGIDHSGPGCPSRSAAGEGDACRPLSRRGKGHCVQAASNSKTMGLAIAKLRQNTSNPLTSRTVQWWR